MCQIIVENCPRSTFEIEELIELESSVRPAVCATENVIGGKRALYTAPGGASYHFIVTFLFSGDFLASLDFRAPLN